MELHDGRMPAGRAGSAVACRRRGWGRCGAGRVWIALLVVVGVPLRVGEAAPPAPRGVASPRAAAEERLVAPAVWLAAQPRPLFKAGHTLPPLTRFGWDLDFDTKKEFAENWGYCLQVEGYASAELVEQWIRDPRSPAGRCVALVRSNPRRYRLAVICARDLPANDRVPVETWARDADGHLLNGQAKSEDGTRWTPGMQPVYSPAAPDAVWVEAGRLRADPLRRLAAHCPISIVLNGGEYGLGNTGALQKVWEKDPTIVAAKGDLPWPDYVSLCKGRAETIIATLVRRAVPQRQLYVYYASGGNAIANSYGQWKEWSFLYDDMRDVSDLPSTQAYYKAFNDGWTGNTDLLTLMLNAKGQEIAAGQPLSYNWLYGGGPADDEQKDMSKVSDIVLWTGFLKLMYVAGMTGGNAGVYAYPRLRPGGFAGAFPPGEPPVWMQQMIALSRVHALFSHLERYLRQGDLLPGPARHRWSKEQPAYEFPTGDPTARVLVRRMREEPLWLVAAWAADGRERDVTVTVPGLGEVTIRAKGIGTLCEAEVIDGKTTLWPVSDE
jgi:hypothetical protein